GPLLVRSEFGGSTVRIFRVEHPVLLPFGLVERTQPIGGGHQVGERGDRGGSHKRKVVSADAERMRLPSGEKATARTAPVWPSKGVPIPVVASHTRMVLSSDDDTMSSPSGEKAAWRMANV